jgi:hypothetical protein
VFVQAKDDNPMRDYRDAKAMAKTLRAALAAKGLKVSIGESLELTAKALGTADWNTLAAEIKAAGSKPAKEGPQSDGNAPMTDSANKALERLAKAALGAAKWKTLLAAIRSDVWTTPAKDALERLAKARLGATTWKTLLTSLRSDVSPAPGQEPEAAAGPSGKPQQRFSSGLEASLHRSVTFAGERNHQHITLEHLLLALIEDPDAAEVMEACAVDVATLKAALTQFVDEDLASIVSDTAEPEPTAGFHRVVQRAVIHVQSSGRAQVTGANVLVAIFSEPESRAAFYLKEQGVNRFDAVNFIAHGIRKGDAAA